MANVRPNRVRYLLSLASELLAQATRVRDLIGEVHWLTDGHHKEFLLIELLQRHLPSGMIASRGFVIDPNDDEVCSREQDILIVDTSAEGPVLNQGGVVIAFPRSIRAAISVKTTCSKKTVIESIGNLNSVRKIVGRHVPPRDVWCGSYYYEPDSPVVNNPNKGIEYIAEGIKQHPVPSVAAIDPQPYPQGPELHCTGEDFGYRLTHSYRSGGAKLEPSKIHGYRCKGLATALFLGSLFDHLTRSRGQGDADYSILTDGHDFDLFGEEELVPAT